VVGRIGERRESPDLRAPAVFVSHGSPLAVMDEDFKQALRRFGAQTRPPKHLVVVSAHWQGPRPVRVTGSARPETIRDFEGFPSWLSTFSYRCPGDPVLAQRIVDMLNAAGINAAVDPSRGLDSAAWGPVSIMYPSAKVPVIQVSLPAPVEPEEMLTIGRTLSLLRREGTLVIGSGGLVHNLSRVSFDMRSPSTEGWAMAFDNWMREHIEALDIEVLCQYRRKAPMAHLAAPTSEHLDPLFFALGARLPGDVVSWLTEGFHGGNLSLRSFALAGRRPEDQRLPPDLTFAP